MFEGFDKAVLVDPEFKEDAVREEIVAPILKRLGYRPSGPIRVQRSKNLLHPFVHIGTRKHPVNIIPDYTLFAEDKPVLILDAKNPAEDIRHSRHVEQAYSYAIHPEIRCKHFALCNGRHLTVFHIEERAPLLDLDFDEFDKRWVEIEKHISPRHLLMPELREFHPDFGTLVSRLGFAVGSVVIFPSCHLQMIAKLSDDYFTATASSDFGDSPYMASFDFAHPDLSSVLSCLAQPLVEAVHAALSRAPFQVDTGLMLDVAWETRLGEPTHGQHDAFTPFEVTKVISSKLNRQPLNESDDVPPHIFRLRPAFERLRRG